MINYTSLPVPRPASPDDISLKELVAHYRKIKPAIKARIAEFRSVIESGSDHDIFTESCFCILTANASALRCYDAIKELSGGGLLVNGAAHEIRPKLKGRARFHNKKAEYIVGARKLFKTGKCLNIMDRLDRGDIIATRDWFVANIKGYGYKEASHFLRNIGLGADIAILDRHILKNLKRYGVIDAIPPSIGPRKVYVAIEDKMRAFSKRIGIPLDELDLLLWSMQTGFIFK
jgi:N-glycosylase/DNA lyase